MIKKFLVSILFFFASYKIISGQVVINEFSSFTSSDWVEIYNIGIDQVDLSNYLIRDSTESNKIDLSGVIQNGSFLAFDFSNRLNKDGDVIKLIKLNGINEELVDSISYGGVGQVCISENDLETIGRVPNGGNVIERYSSGTKSASNETATLNPCPTPSPLPTNSPTSTPKPTNTTTSTPSPKPSSTIIPTLPPKPTSTPTSIVINLSNPPTLTEDGNTFNSGSVAGLGVTGSVDNKTIESSSDIAEKKKLPLAAIALITGGGVLLGVSLIPIIRNFKNEKQQK